MMMTPPHFCICYPQGVVSFRFCHRLPYMELELPSLLGTILTGDSSRNHWGHSDTPHRPLSHAKDTHMHYFAHVSVHTHYVTDTQRQSTKHVVHVCTAAARM